jgi:hypothetical protein
VEVFSFSLAKFSNMAAKFGCKEGRLVEATGFSLDRICGYPNTHISVSWAHSLYLEGLFYYEG